jgi:dolichol-phosphate mannosyltransferase
MQLQVSVIVPMHNESANVKPLAERIMRAVGATPGGMEMILVDDASTDDTWDQILAVCRAASCARGFRHLRNAGQSAAIWTGLRASRGRILATLDGDLQNDPADFLAMLAQLSECDMVCGARLNRADGFLRRISTRVARWARALFLGVDFADTGCNLRVFKREVLELLPPFDGIHRFMPVLAHNAGARVKEVAVSHHPRGSGRSHYGVWNRLGRGLRDLLMVRLYLKRQFKQLPIEEANPVASKEKPGGNPAGGQAL